MPETTRHPILTLAAAREGPRAVVEVRGPLDLDTVGPLVDFVDDTVLTGRPPAVLVLDLSEVTFFSAAGITALLRVRRRVAVGGCALVVREPSRIVLAVLAMVGLDNEFITE